MVGKVSFHVSLIVLVIDDFTGKPVGENRVSLSIAERTALGKKGGYHIFINVKEEKVAIICKSEIYQQRTVRVDLSQRDEQEILIIRLLPAAGYPIPNGTMCVTGQTDADRKLLFWNEESSEYKLLYDYSKKSGMIHIYHPSGKELVGKSFFIRDRENGAKEYFRVIGKKEQQYVMDRKLSADYKKLGTTVIPVYEAETDGQGRFFLMLPNGQGSEAGIIYCAEGETEKPIDLKAGEINTIVV